MKNDFDFIEEFRKLDLVSPKCGSWTRASENCSYGDIITGSRDCYMCFNSGNCRDTYYCEDSRGLNDCVDCALCEGCELCYECVDCENCYGSNYSQDCKNCNDIYFCYDLRRCKDCIGCTGLRDKQYCIFNEQLTKEEYEKKKQMLNLLTSSASDTGEHDVHSRVEAGLLFIQQKLETMTAGTPKMYVHQNDTENCTGDYVYHSKNCHQCFDTRHTEDSGYIYQANLDMGTRDSWDCGPIPTGMDLCYDVAYAHFLFNCKHVYWCGNLKDSQWVINCLEASNLFGCNYLQKKEGGFWLLNEQVEEDYWRMKTAEITQSLKDRGIYTLWDLLYKDLDALVVKVEDAARDRRCQVCDAGFELCDKEIEFYKKREIAHPVYCPDCRNDQRVSMRPERKMYRRKCDSCKETLITTYQEDCPYKVYCLDCYWKNIG